MNYRVMAPFLVLAILTYLLFTGIGLSYSTVRIIANQITVKLIAPVDCSIEPLKGTMKIETLAIIKNDAPWSIEVESGLYEVYLELSSESQRIAYGSIPPTVIKPHSWKPVPIKLAVDLKSLPKIITQTLLGTLPEPLSNFISAKDIKLTIKITLNLPVRILGIKLTTFQTSKTHQIELFK